MRSQQFIEHARRALGWPIVLAAGLAMSTSAAATHDTMPGECSGDRVVALAYEGDRRQANRLYSFTRNSDMHLSITRPLEPMPAGSYTVSAVSYDAYPGREDAEGQDHESWFVRVLDDDGAVLATSAATPDLADGVEAATWSGSLGTLVWPSGTATQLQLVHHAIGADATNSVSPVCVSLTIERAADPGAGEQLRPDLAPTTPVTPVAQPTPSEPAFTG